MGTKSKKNYRNGVENGTKNDDTPQNNAPKRPGVIAEDHLPPLALVFTVMACSGFLWVLGLRDAISTGREILGPIDASFLAFTKSTDWFDDSKGWKSTMGGISSIETITTDANNMGGLFVRKVAGAAFLAVQLHKLIPLLFHPPKSQWICGHFRPFLAMSVLADVSTLGFLSFYMDDLKLGGADELPMLMMGSLAFESAAMIYFLLSQRKIGRGPAIAMPRGKTPNSLPSRIVARTVGIVSTIMVMVAGRDFFFPGYILRFFPRDDIYLEWTGAFFHSPPEGTPEAATQGVEAPLYIGDKFVSQFLALNILILCFYKFVSAFLIKLGSNGSGEIKCRMIWMVSAIGDGLLVFFFRLFAPAAESASLDLRWHLMCVAYEAFILGLMSFW